MEIIMKESVSTDKAPSAIGPYSQGIRVSGGSMLFLSGQIPLDPQTMEITGTNASEQCAKVMENIGELLKAAGATFENIVKSTIYLADMGDFGAVNEIYGKYFGENPPARACVEVSRLPRDVLVEIESIAAV